MTKQTISRKLWKTVKMEKPIRKILFGIDAPVVVNQEVFSKEMQENIRLAEVEKEIKS